MEVDEAEVVDLVLQPGEMSLHHVNLVHGSEPNTTDGWLVGFTVRYVRPDVRQLGDELPLAVLARGRDDHGNYRLVERPAERPLDEAVEALREFNRDFLSRLMPTPE